jgi:hypothetical protein
VFVWPAGCFHSSGIGGGGGGDITTFMTSSAYPLSCVSIKRVKFTTCPTIWNLRFLKSCYHDVGGHI